MLFFVFFGAVLLGGHVISGIPKLRDIDHPEVFDADIKYYRSANGTVAVMSCALNPIKYYSTYVVARTGEPQNVKIENGVKALIPMAGGVNVSFSATYHNGKWEGDDFLEYKKRRFEQVGCYHGEYYAQLAFYS